MSNLQVQQEQFSLTPKTFQEAMKYAELIASSDLAPKDYKGKPGNVMVALQMGAEIGLKPLQALQNIAVINGRPCVWGDAMLAIVRAHPDFEDINEYDDNGIAVCTIKRKNQSPVKRTFSSADAKTAGLLNKQGPWTQYPARMRQMRARAFALRDAFPDALKGLSSAEEAQDQPIEKDITPTRVSNALKDLGIAKQPEPVIEHKEEPAATIYDDNGYTQEQLSMLTDDLLKAIQSAKTIEDLDDIKETAKPLTGNLRQTVVSAYKARKTKIMSESVAETDDQTEAAKEYFGDNQ